MRPLVLINGARPSSRGGDEEDRTPDPLRARQVLSQLSYTPIFQGLRIAYLFPSSFQVSEDSFRTFKIEQQLNFILTEL